jgi:hypothetical protein
MTNSQVEEIIAVLWLIAGLIALHAGFLVGWIFIVKSFFDGACSVYFGIKEKSEGE